MADNFYFNMKKKFNPDLLKEEINRFKLLNEYDFYQEKKELPEYKELILGDLEEDEKAPDDLEASADNIASDLGVDAPDIGGEPSQDAPDNGGELSQDFGGEIPEPAPEPANDDVEVDVTSLVKGSEEAKKSAEMANQNSERLLQKLTDLEKRIASMDQVSNKIDALEKEMIKRNPTPVEKLEMRSLSSYPYSQKLTDYWADKQGPYDVMGNESKKKEYVLTKDDIDSDYSDANIKNSFNVNPDDNEYTEQDI